MPHLDLDQVATFDWGSAALAYLYYRLDIVCRGTVTMYGFQHVLHVRIFIPFLTFFISYTISLLIHLLSDLGYRGWTHSRL